MPSTSSSDKVNFSGYISRELYERFQERFPMYGAATWAVNCFLTEFLDRLDREPELQQQIEESIKAMVYLNHRF